MIFVLSCVLLLVLQGAGEQPNNRPSNGVQLYLPYETKIIPDFSMIRGGQFFDGDRNNDGTIDVLWCQSANNDSNIGVWYYPDGTIVPLATSIGNFHESNPTYSTKFSGQIALVRRVGLSGYEGLYTCIIPDENRINQTLVVGAYGDYVYYTNNGPDADSSMQFSLISPRNANPPVFTLTFNVSDGPPTDVTCTDGNNPVDIASGDLSRVVVNGTASVTQVTVTLRMRQAGIYQCTVSNARVDAGNIRGVTARNSSTSSQPISVAGTPTGLTATRLNAGLAHVQLSWSPVSGVAGYEVFYQLCSNNNSVMSAGTTSSTELNINSGLSSSETYNFFVVSYGNESSTILPSDHSDIATVTFSTNLTQQPCLVTGLIQSGIDVHMINITWNAPTVPNGVIIMYEIRYREINSNGPYSMAYTINTQYSIEGLLPYTNYTIGVRASTSVGPGEWTDKQFYTIDLPVVEDLSVQLIEGMTLISWTPLDNIYLKNYILQYKQVDQVAFKVIELPSSVTILGVSNLQVGTEYIFQISSVVTVNGVEYNAPISSPMTVLIPGQVLSTESSLITVTASPISSTASLKLKDICIVPIIGISLAVVILLILIVLCNVLLLCCYKKRYCSTNNRMSIAMTTITPTPCHEKAMDQSYYINVNDTTNYSHDNMPNHNEALYEIVDQERTYEVTDEHIYEGTDYDILRVTT